MAEKIFKKYRYDIALHDGVGAHMISWITGLMVFFMTLTLAANIGLATLAADWVGNLAGTLTVEIKPPAQDSSGKVPEADKKSFDDKIQKILWLAKQHPAVEEGRIVPDAEVRGLIEPWLGGKMSSEVPLPALIDIRLASHADVAKLQQDIRELVPEVVIDTHESTLNDVRTLMNTVRGFVLLLTAVIILVTIFAISGIVRAKLSIHRPEVETLHLLGADDEYIARQFRHHTLRGTVRGALIGVLAMVICILAIGNITHTIDSALLPHLRLMPLAWAGLFLAPIAAGALIAHATAQLTVLRALSRMS